MLDRRLYPILAAALLIAPLPAFAATPGAVQAEQSPTMPAPSGAAFGHGKGGKLAAFLTPQQRAMFMLQARQQTRDMTPDQRKAWRKDQVRKLSSMSPGDRQKFIADLDARWAALPPAQQARLQQRLARQGQQPAAQ